MIFALATNFHLWQNIFTHYFCFYEQTLTLKNSVREVVIRCPRSGDFKHRSGLLETLEKN